MSNKRLPIEVLERARAVAKDRVAAPRPPALTPPRPTAVKIPLRNAREKVVAALKRLHPMD